MEVTFLGHKIAREGIKDSKNRARATIGFIEPSSIMELNAFLAGRLQYSF